MPTKIKPKFIILLLFVSLSLLSPSLGLTAKIITAEDDNVTTKAYSETNENGYYYYTFKISNDISLKFSIKSEENEPGSGLLIVFQILNGKESVVEKVEISETKYAEIKINLEKSKTSYFLMYEYSKKNSFLMKFCHLDKEIYSVPQKKYEEDIQELFYSNNQEIYILASSLYFEGGFISSIKLSGDFGQINENISYVESTYYEGEYNDIVKAMIDDLENKPAINFAEKKKLDKNKIIYYQNATSDIFRMYKIQITDKLNNNIESANISYIMKKDIDVWNISSSSISKRFYSGDFYYFNISKYRKNDYNFSIILYTNVSSIMDIILTNEENAKKYKLGDTSSINGKVIKNDKLTVINNFNNSNDALIVAISNSKEDYLLRIIPLQELNYKINNQSSRTDSISLINHYTGKYYAVFNRYEKQEEYVQFIDFPLDMFIKPNLPVYFDLDNPGNTIEIKWTGPIKTKAKNELILFEKYNNQTMNNYVIKCQKHYNEQLKEGDFIQICLEPNEETNIKMPEKDNVDYKVSLMLHSENQNDTHSVIFNDENKRRISLNINNKEYKSKWNFSNQETINIKNNGNIFVLLFLGIEAKKSDIIIMKESTDPIKLKPNTLYALLFKSDFSNFYGAYQELLLADNVDNLCLFSDFYSNYSFTFPPKKSCKKYSKGSIEFNITLADVFYVMKENESLYTLVYFTENTINSLDITLNYRNIRFGVFPSLIAFNETRDIIYAEIHQEERKKKDKLFFQMIKNNIHENVKFSVQRFNLINDELVLKDYVPVEIKDQLEYHQMVNLDYSKQDQFIFRFIGTIECLFIYELGYSTDKSFTFNYIENNAISAKLKQDSKTRYLLDFKPLVTNGNAIYQIIAFPTYKYDINEVKKPLFLYYYNEEDKRLKEFNLTSNKGEFRPEDKKNFYMDLKDGINYYIFGRAVKKNPSGVKIYYPYDGDDTNNEPSNSNVIVIVIFFVCVLALVIIFYFIFKKSKKAKSSDDIESEIKKNPSEQPLVSELN